MIALIYLGLVLLFFALVVGAVVMIYADHVRTTAAERYVVCIGCGCLTDPRAITRSGVCTECAYALERAKKQVEFTTGLHSSMPAVDAVEEYQQLTGSERKVS